MYFSRPISSTDTNSNYINLLHISGIPALRYNFQKKYLLKTNKNQTALNRKLTIFFQARLQVNLLNKIFYYA